MVRDTAFQPASQSQSKRQSLSSWYSFIRAAIIAGFEAYGSAQIGICPAKLLGLHPDSGGSVPEVDGLPARNLPVANAAALNLFNVRSGPTEGAVTAVWKLA